MIRIQALDAVDMALFKRLIVGYTSHEKYEVSRQDSAELIQFQFELRGLAEPYVKEYELEEEAYYQAIVEAGLSLVAYDGDNPVALGLADYQSWNRSFWIQEFHVLKSYQKQGIGRQLMEVLVEKAKSTPARIIVLETQNTNVPAFRFYSKMGFIIDGMDLSFYSNDDVTDGEVAIFMKRHLSSNGA